MSDSAAFNVRRQLGMSAPETTWVGLQNHDESGRRDDALAQSGIAPDVRRQAALEASVIAPSAPNDALYAYGSEPTGALERGLGFGRQIDPPDDDETWWEATRSLANNATHTAMEVGRAMWEAHKFWERDISAGQRLWRTANVASLALPFAAGSKAAALALSKIFPSAAGALAINAKGRVVLAGLSEATVAGGLEMLNPERGDRSVVGSALIGAAVGVGGGVLITRADKARRAAASAGVRQRLADGVTVQEALRNDSWAILRVADNDDVAFRASQEADALRYHDAEAKHAWLNMRAEPEAPNTATLDRLAARSAVMMDNLSAAGFQPVAARLADGSDGILIPGLPASEAAYLGRIFGNERVLTNAGEIDLQRNLLRPTVEHKVGMGTELGVDQVYSFARSGTDGTGADGMQHFVARLSDDTVDFVTGNKPFSRLVHSMYDQSGRNSRFHQWFADLDSRAVLSHLYRRTINGYHGAYVFDEWANPGRVSRARGGMRGVEDILDETTVTTGNGIQKMMQLFQGKWSGYAETALRHGVRRWDDAAPFKHGAVDEAGEGFMRIMADVPQSEYQDLIDFGTLLRQEQFAELGRPVAHVFDKGSKEETLSFIRGQIAEIVGGDKEKQRRLTELVQRVTSFQNAVNRDLLVRTRIIDEAAHESIKYANPLYVPSTRLRPKKLGTYDELDTALLDVQRNAEVRDPLMRVSTEVDALDKWVPWDEEIMLQTAAKARLAGQQEVYNRLGEIVEASPEWFRDFARIVDPEKAGLNPAKFDVGGGHVVTASSFTDKSGMFYVKGISKDGREIWMELGRGNKGQALKDALEMMGPQRVGTLTRMFGQFARAQRAGVVIDPTFIGKSVARDLPYAMVNAGLNPLAFIDGATALVADSKMGRAFLTGPRAQRMQALVEQWKTGGGARAALQSMDRNAMVNVLRDAESQRSAGRAIRNAVVKNPLDHFAAVSELIENSTRVGAFRKRYNQLLAESAKRGVPLDPKVLLDEAALYAREVSVDFQVRGASELMGSLRITTAFFNAAVQGGDQLRKALARDPMGVSARMLAGITMPSVMLYLLNRRDPEYSQIKREERNMYWHVKRPQGMLGDDPDDPADDKWLRFPKPFEPGLIAGSMVERFLEFVDENDPELLDHAYDELFSQMAAGFTPMPSVLGPILENKSNIDSYTGGPIVPEGMQDVDPDMLDEGTGFARGLARMLNAGVDDPSDKINPLHIDNLVRGWAGGVGAEATSVADIVVEAARSARGEPAPHDPAKEFIEVAPVLRAFVSSFPAGNQPVADAYQHAEEMRSVGRTIQYLEDSMATDDLVDYTLANLESVGLQQAHQELQGRLSQLRDMRRTVLAAPGVDQQQKRRILHTIDRSIMTYADTFNAVYKELGLHPGDPQPPIARQLRAILGGAQSR